jgi:GH25 family lysozyme M1 (1,4-beta-N-acetylmuramidase)
MALAGIVVDGKRFALRQGGGHLTVLDVSHHQKPGSFSLEGHDGLIVRATYGTKPDALASTHAKVALDESKLVGAYHFYRQTQPKEAQLAAFIASMQNASADVIAPTVDLEWNKAHGDGEVSRETFNTDARWMVEKLAARFGQCMIYLTPYFWFDVLGKPDWVMDHVLWLAHYTKPGWPALPPTQPMPLKHWAGHQYQGAPLDTSVFQYIPLAERRDLAA